MTNPTPTDTDDSTPPTAPEPPTADELAADEPTADLAAAVVEYDDDPDECTIYPAEASDDALVTEWITAEEDSFVGLDEMR